MELTQIVCSPSGAGEVRIPALCRIDRDFICFFDVRPQPPGGDGAHFNGEVMASDLPNPNALHWTVRTSSGTWSAPRRVIGGPEISSDACVAYTGGEITLAYASVSEPVSYISSTRHGPRLEPWVATGPRPDQLEHRRLDELYELCNADALFATSGSTATTGDVVLVPYVVRRGERTAVHIAHLRGGELCALSDPISHPRINLDETTLGVHDGEIIVNARAQGFEGKGAGMRIIARSRDGLSFSVPEIWELNDPGCNGVQIRQWFIHPGSRSARENGVITDMETHTSHPLFAGSFGYSDGMLIDDHLMLIFESDKRLLELTIPSDDLGI